MPDPNPIQLHLMEALMGVPVAQSINLDQNRQGNQLCVDADLPTKGFSENKETFASWGIVAKEEQGEDKLFTRVSMPPGWKKERTGHSMWFNLLDPKGNSRASIFFKSAFYDRDAFMRLNTRFSPRYLTDINERYLKEKERPDTSGYPAICDGKDNPFWRGKKGVFDSEDGRFIAKFVLDLYYPEWKDPKAYWDIESPVFPKWESEPPKGNLYKLHVKYENYSHNGAPVYVDEGWSIETIQPSDQEGINFLRKNYYDSGYPICTLSFFKVEADGKTTRINELILRKPRPKPKRHLYDPFDLWDRPRRFGYHDSEDDTE